MVLGLPTAVRACLFDLDEVLTHTATVAELGARKNEWVLHLIRERGVEPYGGSVRYVHAVSGGRLELRHYAETVTARADKPVARRIPPETTRPAPTQPPGRAPASRQGA